MNKVQFIEGAGYCEPSKKGDKFANHLTVLDVLRPSAPKKKHKRKKETIQHLNDLLRYEQLKKELSYEINRTTEKV